MKKEKHFDWKLQKLNMTTTFHVKMMTNIKCERKSTNTRKVQKVHVAPTFYVKLGIKQEKKSTF